MEDFEKWAAANSFDITKAVGIGYVNATTAIAYSAWKARSEIQSGLLYDYGICEQCNTHYVHVESEIDPLNGAIECDCMRDIYRETKIIAMLSEQGH